MPRPDPAAARDRQQARKIARAPQPAAQASARAPAPAAQPVQAAKAENAKPIPHQALRVHRAQARNTYARKASRTADLHRQEQADHPAREVTTEAVPQTAVTQAEATTAAEAQAAAIAAAAEAQAVAVATAVEAEAQVAVAAVRAEAGEDKFFRNP